MLRLRVPIAGGGATAVAIGRGALEEIERRAEGRRLFLVADRRVARLHGAAVRRALGGRLAGELLLPEGEAGKRAARLPALWERLARLGPRRDDWLVGLGGGAALDLTGFLASVWMRGIDWVALPTSLVGQSDACIGGKTAVDLAAGKNLVGSFHPPRAALVDPGFLATEPARGFRAGRFELLKCGWIADPALVRLALSPAFARREPGALARTVARALRVKARLVAGDLHDRAGRRLLNLGHTFGHGLEAASGYRRYRHGEAVGIGLLAALCLARRLGVIGADAFAARQAEVLALAPPAVPDRLLRPAVEAALLDKKRGPGSRLVVVLPTDHGAIVHPGVPVRPFAGALAEAAGLLAASRRRRGSL